PIVPYVNLCRIAKPAPIEAGRHEEGADPNMRQRAILRVKEDYAFDDDTRLMFLLDPKPLPRVSPPKTLFKDCQDILVRHAASQSMRFDLIGHVRCYLR